MGENEKMQAHFILKFIPISEWNYRSVMNAGVTLLKSLDIFCGEASFPPTKIKT